MYNKTLLRNEYEMFLDKYRFTDSKLGSHWLYSENFNMKCIPESGFKIHVSSTVFNAIHIQEACIPYLEQNSIQFKVVRKLNLFELQNRGVFGFSQIGKLITIYPSDFNEFKKVINDLYLKTKLIEGVNIPSDFKYRSSKVIFYRYGAFIDIKKNNKYYMKLPNGNIVEDKRDKSIPRDINLDFSDYKIDRVLELPKRFLILEILRKRGKGGTYKVLDLKDRKLKIMKEGTYLGELEESGIDGLDRALWEFYLLELFNELDYTPNVYEKFYVENSFFFIQEFKKGRTLEDFSLNKSISRKEAQNILSKIAHKIIELNSLYGVIIRDLSMTNILIDENLNISLIDFEYAHINEQGAPPVIKIGSPGFYDESTNGVSIKDDIYSLVCIYYYLLNPSSYKKLINSNIDLYRRSVNYTNKDLSSMNKEDINIIEKGLNYEIESVSELLSLLNEMLVK
ncbi:protein kinase domain-containing protein [Amphibacillus indicireducens]|uniref:Protein kinase domain-containing protein n=1 Tax=Amphibacillus indicireducens TaxID=1076330 RepID=A0ABP7VV08_9BACI